MKQLWVNFKSCTKLPKFWVNYNKFERNVFCFRQADALESCTEHRINNVPNCLFTRRVLQGQHKPQLSLALHLHTCVNRFGNEDFLKCLGICELWVVPGSLEILLHLGSWFIICFIFCEKLLWSDSLLDSLKKFWSQLSDKQYWLRL